MDIRAWQILSGLIFGAKRGASLWGSFGDLYELCICLLSVQLRLERWEYCLISMCASSQAPMYSSQMKSRLPNKSGYDSVYGRKHILEYDRTIQVFSRHFVGEDADPCMRLCLWRRAEKALPRILCWLAKMYEMSTYPCFTAPDHATNTTAAPTIQHSQRSLPILHYYSICYLKIYTLLGALRILPYHYLLLPAQEPSPSSGAFIKCCALANYSRQSLSTLNEFVEYAIRTVLERAKEIVGL